MSMPTTATVARACRAGVAASALVVLSASLSASLAQSFFGPRTIIVANYQQTSIAVSTDAITQGDCEGASFCFVLFQRVPQQKGLVVQHVSCMGFNSAGEPVFARLATQGERNGPKTSHLAPVPTTGGAWVISSPVMHLFKSKERPLVVLRNSTSADWAGVECTISGKLQQP